MLILIYIEKEGNIQAFYYLILDLFFCSLFKQVHTDPARDISWPDTGLKVKGQIVKKKDFLKGNGVIMTLYLHILLKQMDKKTMLCTSTK